MSELVLRRARARSRRRRPPGARWLLHAAVIGALISQTVWVAGMAARGEWFDLLLLLIYPLLWSVQLRQIRVQREWEQRGYPPLPTDRMDWLLVGVLWLIQITLWTVATP